MAGRASAKPITQSRSLASVISALNLVVHLAMIDCPDAKDPVRMDSSVSPAVLRTTTFNMRTMGGSEKQFAIHRSLVVGVRVENLALVQMIKTTRQTS
jgi:hypothetical protein